MVKNILKRTLATVMVVLILLTSAPLGGFVGMDWSWFDLKTEAVSGVPDDAVEFNGHYYKIIPGNYSWSEASIICESAGGHLATITSAEEQQVIENLLAEYGYGNTFWLGAANSSGTFQWINGDPWNYSKWSSNQPDNINNKQSCLRIYGLYDYFGEWDDYFDCTDGMNGAICEWDSSSRKVFVAKFEDFTYTVIINGTEQWISKIKLDGKTYPVKENLLPLSFADNVGSEVVVTTEDDTVVSCFPKSQKTNYLAGHFISGNSIKYKNKKYNCEEVTMYLTLSNCIMNDFVDQKEDLRNLNDFDIVLSSINLTSDNPELINFSGKDSITINDCSGTIIPLFENVKATLVANVNQKHKIDKNNT